MLLVIMDAADMCALLDGVAAGSSGLVFESDTGFVGSGKRTSSGAVLGESIAKRVQANWPSRIQSQYPVLCPVEQEDNIFHLSDPGTYDKQKVGIGISRHAHLLLKAGLRLQDTMYVAILNKNILLEAMAQFTALKPHLLALDIGSIPIRITGSASSMSSLAEQECVYLAALETAAKAFHKYYSQPSVLRWLLSILGKGGTFNTLFADRMAVDYVNVGKVSEGDFVQAMIALAGSRRV